MSTHMHVIISIWAAFGGGLVSGMWLMHRAQPGVRQPPPRARQPISQAPNVIELRRHERQAR